MIRFARFVTLMGALMVLLVAAAYAGANERGLDRANFDTTVSPCVDFDQYANGGWMKNNPIPGAYPAWSVGNEMQQRNQDMLRKVVEEAAANLNAPKGTNLQKIGDFYATGMDTVKIEADGIKPIQSYLERIAAIKTAKDIESTIDFMYASGYDVLFGAEVDQDMKNSTQMIPYCTQGGLGLPDRDYYLRPDSESKQLVAKYSIHLTNMFQLLGDKPEDAKAEAAAVLDIETKLADASLTATESKDPKSFYNLITVAEADKLTPNFSWSGLFKALGHPEFQQFSYAHPKFFARMDTLLVKVPVADWKNYLRWHLIHQTARFLSSAYLMENFRFYSTELSGVKQLRPRWKRILDVTNGGLGEALGELYVAKAFPPASKARAQELVHNLIAAFKVRIEKLDWMSDATKKMALQKLGAVAIKVGYPDKWRDYSALTIDRSSYAENARRAGLFEQQRQLNQVGKPVDRTEWGMSPQTINAYYSPLKNEIVFPAAILQPPYFDGTIDDAINYGAIGAVIGHEMTHGFDNHGCEFDAEGNMKNWWTEVDKAEFDKRTDALVKQFDAYVAIDSLHVNGKLTLGENIGDLGGLLIAYDALQLALTGKDRAPVDGFTPEQRFFLSWAQAWRTNMRPEMVKLQVNTNEHSPAHFRVLGPLSDMPAFYQAFGCKPGTAMVRDDSGIVRIW